MHVPKDSCGSESLVVLGIDPGAHGAIAMLRPDGSLHSVLDMPGNLIKRGSRQVLEVSPYALAQMLMGPALAGLIDRAVIERVGAMPGQGVSSMFAFGRHVGMVEGVLAGLSIPVSYVLPQAWRRQCRVPDGKDGSRLKASQLWPAHAATFQRGKDDGRAEACLIGLSSLVGSCISPTVGARRSPSIRPEPLFTTRASR
jgi:crossover junction endodeoxyribonuclease RuvC